MMPMVGVPALGGTPVRSRRCAGTTPSDLPLNFPTRGHLHERVGVPIRDRKTVVFLDVVDGVAMKPILPRKVQVFADEKCRLDRSVRGADQELTFGALGTHLRPGH